MNHFSKTRTITAIAIILGLLGWIAVKKQNEARLGVQNRDLLEQIARLRIETQHLSRSATDLSDSKALADERFKELLRLRAEVGKLRQQKKEFAKRDAPARSTSEPASPTQETHPENTVPRESWQFVGYATPESALQSAMWAMSKGDVQAFLSSLTPEAQAAMAKQLETKSEPEIAAMLTHEISKIQGLRLDRKRLLADGDVGFVLASEEHDDGATHTRDEALALFKNIGGEWKFTGL